MRTEKVFEEYNDYHDRGMIKWLTAFAMEELTKSISTGTEEALKDIPILPQMSSFEINEVLVEALKKKPSCIRSTESKRSIRASN